MRNIIPVLFIPATEQGDIMIEEEKVYSVYIHIPFCNKKCHFCSIDTKMYEEKKVDLYVTSLINELRKYKIFLSLQKINCIHFGGGTPSILSIQQIKKILLELSRYISNLADVEIVFESNPETLTYEKIDFLTKIPNMTLNVGIQTFQPKQLKKINRLMKVSRVINKLYYAKEKRVKTLGIDIIAGLQYATIATVLEDLAQAIKIGVDYISLYPLRIEYGSVLYESRFFEGCHMTDYKELVNIMNCAKHFLLENDYIQCSIFHWVKGKDTSFQYSKNQINCGEWIGIGAGAYSYLEEKVYQNNSNITDYISANYYGNIIYCSMEKKNLTHKIIWELSFIFRKGIIDLEYIRKKYGVIIEPYINQICQLLYKLGYAIYDEQRRFIITSKGIVKFDEIQKIIGEVMLNRNE